MTHRSIDHIINDGGWGGGPYLECHLVYRDAVSVTRGWEALVDAPYVVGPFEEASWLSLDRGAAADAAQVLGAMLNFQDTSRWSSRPRCYFVLLDPEDPAVTVGAVMGLSNARWLEGRWAMSLYVPPVQVSRCVDSWREKAIESPGQLSAERVATGDHGTLVLPLFALLVRLARRVQRYEPFCLCIIDWEGEWDRELPWTAAPYISVPVGIARAAGLGMRQQTPRYGFLDVV